MFYIILFASYNYISAYLSFFAPSTHVFALPISPYSIIVDTVETSTAMSAQRGRQRRPCHVNQSEFVTRVTLNLHLTERFDGWTVQSYN